MACVQVISTIVINNLILFTQCKLKAVFHRVSEEVNNINDKQIKIKAWKKTLVFLLFKTPISMLYSNTDLKSMLSQIKENSAVH